MEQIETVIIGGGQAGLAMSYYLGQLGSEHVILERHRVAERWQSERWDSLAFQSPNWNIRLPGFAFQTADPDAFASRDEVFRFIEDYAAFIRAPVGCGMPATSLRAETASRLLIVETPESLFRAKNVVIAIGPFQLPADHLPIGGSALHLHSSRYRNPQQLPSGAVLVIGSGNSGAQIAEELCAAGRQVFLSVSKHRRIPRRYRGKDYAWWYIAFGEGDTTVDQQREPLSPRLLTGVGDGHDLDLRHLAAHGVVLLGRVLGGRDGRLTLATDLAEDLARADASLVDFMRQADGYAARQGLDLPDSETGSEALPTPREVTDPIVTLDLATAGISTIILANGFRYDFNWVDLPIFADSAKSSRRVPVHQRGITRVPGVYFLGLPWLHKLKSAFLHGVGDDAAYLAERMTSHGNPWPNSRSREQKPPSGYETPVEFSN
ncbi:MAG TPA: NAD(P)-binding domain-containing protein [Terracidiphilus sp.]|jgi:putative flavoprotein involved in K+ transport